MEGRGLSWVRRGWYGLGGVAVAIADLGLGFVRGCVQSYLYSGFKVPGGG